MSTDPTALAREVLDIHDAWGKTIAGSDECARASDAFTSALRCNGGDLARAVIQLTAELGAYREENTRLREERARMAALADELDREADRIHVRYMDMGDHAHGLRDAYREDAKRIRTALNGDSA